MITQYEVPIILDDELPLMKIRTYTTHLMVNIYRCIHDFAEYTRTAILEHHFTTVRKCFNLAEKLYSEGDKIVKMCIENIFVYFFTTFIPHDKVERLILQSYIPDSLNAVYLKQVSASSC